MGYTGKDDLPWNISENMINTPYFFAGIVI